MSLFWRKYISAIVPWTWKLLDTMKDLQSKKSPKTQRLYLHKMWKNLFFLFLLNVWRFFSGRWTFFFTPILYKACFFIYLCLLFTNLTTTLFPGNTSWLGSKISHFLFCMFIGSQNNWLKRREKSTFFVQTRFQNHHSKMFFAFSVEEFREKLCNTLTNPIPKKYFLVTFEKPYFWHLLPILDSFCLPRKDL